MGEFGEKFRKAREKKGISLEDVSNVTKISVRNLKAIEDQNFELLPGGVFNKGFIRAYAKHIGLNEEEAVTDYLACVRPQIDVEVAPDPSEPEPTREKRRQGSDRRKRERRVASIPQVLSDQSARQIQELPGLQLPREEHVRSPRSLYRQRDAQIPWRLIAAAVVVVVLGAVLWQRHARGPHVQGAPRPAPEAVQPAPTPEPKTSPAVAPVSTTPGAQHGTPLGNSAAPKNQSPPTAGQVAKASSSVNSATNQLPDNAPPEKVPVPAAELANAAKPGPTLTLVIRASENSWVSVMADGQVVSQETLIAPAHTSVHATREIVAKIGNAGGVSFVWNGQEIPAEGGESEVKTFVFDASGMRVLPPAQTPASNH